MLWKKKRKSSKSERLEDDRVCSWVETANIFIVSSPITLNDPAIKEGKNIYTTYRKHNHDGPFTLHHHGKIIPHLKPAKSLMNKNIHNLRRRDEARRCGEEIVGRERAGLDTQGSEREEGFLYESSSK